MHSGTFHQLLGNYVSGGGLRRSDWLSSFVRPSNMFRRNATAVCLAFNQVAGRKGVRAVELELKEYAGNDPHLAALKDSLSVSEGDLVSVILHGSCGDGRTTGYSDVDALVVVRDEVFMDPVRMARLGRKLTACCRHMYRFDPLQHHGWFAVAEQDLSCFPEEVLPLASLTEATVLAGRRSFSLLLPDADAGMFRERALRHIQRVEDLLHPRRRPGNMFQLKSLLSEFMMLPVLLLQAKEGKGCSKRESFTAAAGLFEPETWSVMDEVSAIRREWKYVPGPLAGMVLKRPGYFFRKLRRRIPGPIHRTLKKKLSDDFYRRMAAFATESRLLLRTS
ncbi:MAG: hypothetical protein RL213_1304 [Bacteroidota bacterium]